MNLSKERLPLEQIQDKRFLFLLSLFICLSAFFAFNGSLEWDEGSFLLNAENISGTDVNFEESRPIAISALISGIWFFTGESILASRVMVMFFGTGCILLFHRIASEEFEEPLLPTAAFTLSPIMIYWSSRVYTDVPALLFILASFYSYRKSRYFLSGLMMAFATTFRYLYFLFAVGLFAAYIFEHREEIGSYLTGGFTGSIPFFVYSWVGYGGPLERIEMYITRVTRWSDSGMFAAAFPNTVSAFQMLSGILPLTILGWKRSPVEEKAMILVYSIFMVAFSGNTFTRYWLAVLPFIVLISYRGAGKKIFAVAALVMIVVSAPVVIDEYRTNNECSEPLEKSLEYTSTLDEGLVVSDSWAVSGFYLDRKVYSTWASYDRLNREYGVSYAVVDEKIDYTLLKSYSNNCRGYYVYDLNRPR